jgi:pimeloyl-ACP methyl ester carboxylesterase
LKELEAQVLSMSGFHQFRQEDIEVKPGVHIRTIICGDEKLEKVVLVHGYGSSGCMFNGLMPQICTRFCLILVDLIGMGASSRPKDYKHESISAKESIQYFNDYFELWR